MNGERDIYVRAKRPWNSIAEADAILEEIDAMAKEVGVVFFLWGGTCLGLYRDGIYLRGDADIDFGVHCTDEQREAFTKKLLDHGYTPLGASTKRFVKDDLWVDIYFSGDARLGEQAKYTEGLSHIHYNGLIYQTPFPIEDYLRDAYGEDWNIKKTYFIERFLLPKSVAGKKVYVAIGGEKEELIILDKNRELVRLKKLEVAEDAR